MPWKPEYEENRKRKYAADPGLHAKVKQREKDRVAGQKEAKKAYLKSWLERNREHVRAYRKARADERNARRRELYATKPEHREKARAVSRDWMRRNPRKRLAQRIKRYGLTPEQYDAIFEQQRGGCAVCGKATGHKRARLHIDHCHVTGKVRGLLCVSCNFGIGSLGDDPERIERAAAYVRKHRPSSDQ